MKELQTSLSRFLATHTELPVLFLSAILTLAGLKQVNTVSIDALTAHLGQTIGFVH